MLRVPPIARPYITAFLRILISQVNCYPANDYETQNCINILRRCTVFILLVGGLARTRWTQRDCVYFWDSGSFAVSCCNRNGIRRMITQSAHLALVAEHLRKLIAIAEDENRTKGKWIRMQCEVRSESRITIAECHITTLSAYDLGGKANAAYIAACSVNAESGWRATLAAIEELPFIKATCIAEKWIHDRPSPDGISENIIRSILAQFPLEQLE